MSVLRHSPEPWSSALYGGRMRGILRASLVSAALRRAAGISLVTAVSVSTLNALPSAAAPPAPADVVDIKDFLKKVKNVIMDSKSHGPGDDDGSWDDDGSGDDHGSWDDDGNVPETPAADPCADIAAAGTEPSGISGSSGPTASITFQKRDGGPIMSETVTAVGVGAAWDAVARIDIILKRCPVSEGGGARTTFSRWVPPKVGGDAVVGYTLAVEAKTPAKPSLSRKTVLVAYEGVLVHFTMTGGDTKDAAQFTDLVRTGMKQVEGIGRKLD